MSASTPQSPPAPTPLPPIPSLSIDVARARAETPGCAYVAHLNNAGSSLPPQPVVDAVTDYLRREALVGGYELANAEADRINRYRGAFAELLRVQTNEVAFAFSDTAAWSTAFWGLRNTGAIPRGSRVLVDRASYVSHYLGLLQAARLGDITIEVVPSDESGAFDVEALAGMLDERVGLVSLTHVGAHRGLVNPVDAAGRVLADSSAIYLLDACQSVGHLHVDVPAIGCDVLTATGRKFLRAPRGTGVLWVRESLVDRIDPPGIDGHSASWIDAASYELLPDSRRFEPFEASMATKVGLGVAVDYALSWGIDAIAKRVVALGESLRGLLATEVPGATVLDGGHERCGIVTFGIEGRPAPAVQAALAAEGINVSATSAPSARLDMESRGVAEAVRASVHYYNTDDELQRLADVLRTAP